MCSCPDTDIDPKDVGVSIPFFLDHIKHFSISSHFIIVTIGKLHRESAKRYRRSDLIY